MDILPDTNAARILVIEEDLLTAERIATILRSEGYFVQNVYNSTDATASDPANFDLALINNVMQDSTGGILIEKLKRHPTFSRLPMLVLTDNLDTNASGQLARRSYRDEDLLDRVHQLLRNQTKLRVEPQRRIDLPGRMERDDDTPPTQPMRMAFDAMLAQQLSELKILSKLARSISSVLDLNEVLNQIVEAATELTQAEEGVLLLPDEEGKALYLRAMKGIDDDSARIFRIRTEDPLIGRVYKSGEPLLVSDKGWQRVKTEYFVKSLLYVPLNSKGQTIGVLGVNNRRKERSFTQHDQELLLDLAAHAAIAVENARLYEERLLQNRQLATLVEAGKAVNSTLALDAVLSTICQQIIQALGANACLISQQDPDSGELRPFATARRVVWRPDRGPVCLLESRPIVKKAISENAYFIVSLDKQGSKWEAEVQILKQDGVTGMVMLPIRMGTQTPVGTLELFYRGETPEVNSEFRAHMRNTAMEICSLVTQPTGPLPLSAIFTNAQQILDTSQANWLNLSLIASGEKLVRVVEYGAAVFLDEPRPERIIFPPNVEVFGDHLSLSYLSYHSRKADLPDYVREAMTAYAAEAILGLPLVVKGKAFGAVTIWDTLEARRFQPREISLAWALVTQAATAIENARLYHDLGQSLKELRQTQATLVQAARLSTMGELAAVVAHQINNPLTTIMVDAEIILQDLPVENPIHESVTAIYRSGQRAHAVVKRLLSTARRGSPADALQLIDVYQTICNTLELVTTHIERSRVKLKIDLHENESGYTQAAPGHLEDLWLNLLLNARDALVNLPDATISVRNQRKGDFVEVTISDNGPGIPSEHLEHIFDPFFTTKPAGEGTGLGLYICKQIVDQCGGKIEVETKLKYGTKFLVRLPTKSQ